jgi:hypothetical protein
MERFYAQLKTIDSEITAERIAERKADIPKLIMEGFAKVLYENRKATVTLNGMQKVIYAIVLEYVNIVLKQDAEDAPFTLIGLEQKGSINFSFEANGSAQKIKLFGIIDRVDLKNGIYRIVDYKSGGDKLKYSTIEECFDTDCGNINKALVQTLFYTHVYEQISNNENVEPNLYIVKTMSKDGVSFNGKGGLLKAEFLVSEKQVFLTALRSKLKELFDYSIPFRASQNPGNYVYSIYTTLFGR